MADTTEQPAGAPSSTSFDSFFGSSTTPAPTNPATATPPPVKRVVAADPDESGAHRTAAKTSGAGEAAETGEEAGGWSLISTVVQAAGAFGGAVGDAAGAVSDGLRSGSVVEDPLVTQVRLCCS